MGVTINIDARETQRLIKKLKMWEGKKRKEVVQELRNTARIVQSEARERAPVGTPESTGIPGYVGGTLRASTQVGDERKGGLNQTVESNVHYALWVHEGTTRMKGRPYLREALKGEQADLNKRLERIIEKR